MIEQFTGFAEMIGAIGVILSLLYVGKQLKQTNAMSRSAFRQSMSTALSELAMNIASSPDLCAAIAQAQFHGKVREDVSEQQRMQIGYTYYAIVEQMHMAFEHWKEGLLATEELAEVLGTGSPFITTPYLGSIWPILAPAFPADFNQWFEPRMADHRMR